LSREGTGSTGRYKGETGEWNAYLHGAGRGGREKKGLFPKGLCFPLTEKGKRHADDRTLFAEGRKKKRGDHLSPQRERYRRDWNSNFKKKRTLATSRVRGKEERFNTKKEGNAEPNLSTQDKKDNERPFYKNKPQQRSSSNVWTKKKDIEKKGDAGRLIT